MSFVFQQSYSRKVEYPVIFTHGIFEPHNIALRLIVEKEGLLARKPNGSRVISVMVIVDAGLMDAYPLLSAQLKSYFIEHKEAIELVGDIDLVPSVTCTQRDLRAVSRLHELMADEGLGRNSVVMAIGGSSLLSLVGFAVATLSCSPKFIRMPTTVRAQSFSTLGAVNGIAHGKHTCLLGVDCPPMAVLNDFGFLSAIPIRRQLAGLAELVRYAIACDREFFEELHHHREALVAGDTSVLQTLINHGAARYGNVSSLEGVCGDFSGMCDVQGIQGFGDWLVPELMQLGEGEVLEGEALLIAIAVDCHYAHACGQLLAADLHDIFELLQAFGIKSTAQALSLFCTQRFSEYKEALDVASRKHGPVCIGELADFGKLNVDELYKSLEAVAVVGMLEGS